MGNNDMFSKGNVLRKADQSQEEICPRVSPTEWTVKAVLAVEGKGRV